MKEDIECLKYVLKHGTLDGSIIRLARMIRMMFVTIIILIILVIILR